MLTKRCSAGELTERDIKIFAELNVHTIMSTQHIGAMFAHSETHLNTLEQRLLKLARTGYIAELHKQRGDIKQFMLLQKGMNALATYDVFPARNIKFSQPSLLFRSHDLAVSDFTISLTQTARNHQEPIRVIDEHSIFDRATNSKIKARRGWNVPLSHPVYGLTSLHGLWVKPDKLIGLKFISRPEAKNERYYVIEIDRGTMPHTGTLDRPTILRKLLAYEATIVEGVLNKAFDIPHAYPLFLTTSVARRDRMIALAIEQVGDDKAAHAMRFAVQPASPTYLNYTNMSEIKWITGRGKSAMLPL